MAIDYISRGDKKSMNAPTEEYQRITEGEDIPGGPARYLLVGTAGTATLKKVGGGVAADVPLQAGYNPLVVSQVVSLGTAADVFYCL